jgi:hypothetical protein
MRARDRRKALRSTDEARSMTTIRGSFFVINGEY